MADPLPQPLTFGDTSGDLGDHTQAGSQTLSDTGTVVGDPNTFLAREETISSQVPNRSGHYARPDIFAFSINRKKLPPVAFSD